MPRIDVSYSTGALSSAAQKTLPPQLAAAMLRWEKAPEIVMRELGHQPPS